jgi:hypothetical protein
MGIAVRRGAGRAVKEHPATLGRSSGRDPPSARNRRVFLRNFSLFSRFLVVPQQQAAAREETMKSLFIAITIAATLTASAASAKMMACTSENMAKSVSASNTMPDSPKKQAMMKEIGAANTAMSKGDMRGACKSYMRAQQMAGGS